VSDYQEINIPIPVCYIFIKMTRSCNQNHKPEDISL